MFEIARLQYCCNCITAFITRARATRARQRENPMKQYVAHVTSITPYAQGRKHGAPKLPRESDDAYAQRTALQQLHTHQGHIMIPPMAFHLCLQETASYLSMKIPEKGAQTYTKNFIRGLLFPDPI